MRPVFYGPSYGSGQREELLRPSLPRSRIPPGRPGRRSDPYPWLFLPFRTARAACRSVERIQDARGSPRYSAASEISRR